MCDLACTDCTRALSNPQTTISQIFAVMRQWDSATQGKIDYLIGELFKHGANIDDMDSITGQTALHFACKAGAKGVGNQTVAAKAAADLINRGADINVATLWTNMTPAHLAAFFGCDAVLQHLCRAKAALNTPCADFDGATPLHLAAMTGSIGAVSALLDNGADATARDNFRRTPLQSAKLVMSSGSSDIPAEDWAMVVSLLNDSEQSRPGAAAADTSMATPRATGIPLPRTSPGSALSPGANTNSPSRIPQTRTPTAAAAATAAGSTTPRSGPTYTLPSSGLARPATASAISRPTVTPAASTPTARATAGAAGTPGTAGRPASGIARPVSATSAARGPAARVGSGGSGATASPRTPRAASVPGGLPLGSRVMVADNHGVVRFVGPTSFDTGTFIGVELDDPVGKNDGSVEGVSYFKCEPGHGLFVRPARCTFRGLSCANLVS